MTKRKFDNLVQSTRLSLPETCDIDAYGKMYMDVFQTYSMELDKKEITPWDVQTIAQKAKKYLLSKWNAIDNWLVDKVSR